MAQTIDLELTADGWPKTGEERYTAPTSFGIHSNASGGIGRLFHNIERGRRTSPFGAYGGLIDKNHSFTLVSSYSVQHLAVRLSSSIFIGETGEDEVTSGFNDLPPSPDPIGCLDQVVLGSCSITDGQWWETMELGVLDQVDCHEKSNVAKSDKTDLEVRHVGSKDLI